MEGGVLFRCRKCGVEAADLSAHDCRPSAARLLELLGPPEGERAKAALAPVRAAMAKPPGFDRKAYQKSYMKAYMRAWRARKRGAP